MWEHWQVRSCGLLFLVAVGLGGCQAGWPLDRPSGSIDPAVFMNVWKTYTHCRSSSDPDDIRVDAQYLDRAAYAMESKSQSPNVLPMAMQHLVSKLPSRLAVDPQAMALDCALYGGQVAQVVGRTRLAEELFHVVLAKQAEAAYGYYMFEASRRLEHMGRDGHSIGVPGSFVTQAMEGYVDRVAMVTRRPHRLLSPVESDAQLWQPSGFYRNMLLRSEGGGDGMRRVQASVAPLSSLAARCPASASVRPYDISVINVEIPLNWWLSFSYPGYMYVLTENIDRVREEEATNRAARLNKTNNPGAGMKGVRGRWIQPLVIRGGQGDCVKISFRNQLESGEELRLHIDGASLVVHATGQFANMTNSDAMAAPGQSIDLEWYLDPAMQEGARQFHSYSHERELTVMGLFGTFLVEPKNAAYLDLLGSGEQTSLKSDVNLSQHDGQPERKQ